MSSTNHHDDRIEVLSVPDDAPHPRGGARDATPPPSLEPINFTPADRPSGLQRNGSARGHRHQYYNLATHGSHEDHVALGLAGTPPGPGVGGIPAGGGAGSGGGGFTPLSPGDDSLRMLTTPLSHLRGEVEEEEEEDEGQTKQQKRVARIVAVIAGALILMSVLLVTVTMRMSDHIDDMVRKMNGIGTTTPFPPHRPTAPPRTLPPTQPSSNTSHPYTPPTS